MRMAKNRRKVNYLNQIGTGNKVLKHKIVRIMYLKINSKLIWYGKPNVRYYLQTKFTQY